MAELGVIGWIARILVIVGALNWGLVGLFQWDLVANVFGAVGTWLSTLVYVLVALSGIWELIALFK